MMRSPLGVSLTVLLCGLLLAACVASPAAAPAPQPTAPATSVPTAASEPTPPPAASTTAPAASPAPESAAPASAGVLRVATSLDNPPFSYADDQGRPTGFDIALITELAARLGLSVEITDTSFENLWAALSIGQADAAIAALSITPERAAQADFTNAYYVGEDGVLAALNSGVRAVSSLDDLAKLRVGVQKGSLYEEWVRQNGVDANRMPAENLLAYASPNEAVQALGAGAIDVVLLDRQPALTFVQESKAKLVGGGLYPQVYGIATAKDASLRSELNRALAEVQADGTMARLVQKHLRMPASAVLPATRRPLASPTP